jgi:group I intron endonuclease
MRKEKRYHFIYKTTNLINNRYYIGLHSTNDLDDGYLGSGTYIRRAIKKHGKKNFKREILEFCKSRKDVILREKELVTLLEVGDYECMNMIQGGQSAEIITHTEETRRKISNALKGRKVTWADKISKSNTGKTRSKEVRKKYSDIAKNRTFSEETRKRMSESNRGYQSQESKQKISKSNKGENNGMFGKKQSEETRKKMSESQLNRTDKRGFYTNHTSWNTGLDMTDDVKKKISDKLKGVRQPKLECPHCNKIGGLPQMKRYHFNNCKKL